MPKVSVIVPVRDGADDIAILLDHLSRQTLPREDFEIVMVTMDRPTTGSRQSPRPTATFGSWFDPQNSYPARNSAVAASRAPILASCDADCRPEPEWLERGLSVVAATDGAAGRIRFDLPPRLSAWALVDMEASEDHEHQVRVGVAETANLFLRRELFDRMGGFDGTIPEYGDFEFVERCVAAGAQLSYAPDAVVSHPVRTSGRSLLRALWKYNRGYAVHAGRAGVVPEAVKFRSWVRSFRQSAAGVDGADRSALTAHGCAERSQADSAQSSPNCSDHLLVVPYSAALRNFAAGSTEPSFVAFVGAGVAVAVLAAGVAVAVCAGAGRACSDEGSPGRREPH